MRTTIETVYKMPIPTSWGAETRIIDDCSGDISILVRYSCDRDQCGLGGRVVTAKFIDVARLRAALSEGPGWLPGSQAESAIKWAYDSVVVVEYGAHFPKNVSSRTRRPLHHYALSSDSSGGYEVLATACEVVVGPACPCGSGWPAGVLPGVVARHGEE